MEGLAQMAQEFLKWFSSMGLPVWRVTSIKRTSSSPWTPRWGWAASSMTYPFWDPPAHADICRLSGRVYPQVISCHHLHLMALEPKVRLAHLWPDLKWWAGPIRVFVCVCLFLVPGIRSTKWRKGFLRPPEVLFMLPFWASCNSGWAVNAGLGRDKSGRRIIKGPTAAWAAT